jgi:Ca2+-binding EF-hand superfamily protein
MSSEENERDNDNLKENNQNLDLNLDELTKLTNFTFGQINNFRKYFRKCKLNSDSNGNSDLLNKQEFKNSLGVLSTRSCDYISNRLFQVITGENREYLSFREYILYLDLVNYGSKDDKLKHCFKFFDIGNKGFITNKDFTTILYNLCLFLSSLTISQILVNENELSLLYDHYISKARIQQLDFPHFKILLDNFPSFLDFYDIFNNNIYYEMNFLIKKEQMEKLISIKDKLYELKYILNTSQIKNSSVSLVTEDYIDDILEQKKDIENISSISLETKNNGLDNNNMNNENNFMNFGLSDYLVFSRAESDNDNKSNGKANSTYNKKIKKEKKIYIPSFPKDTQFLVNQFNHLVKNNSNTKVQKKNDKSNDDTTFDLSESSCENENLDNSFNSIGKNNSIRNNSKKKKRNFKNIISGELNKEESFKIKKSKNTNNTKNIFEVLEKKKKNFIF